MSHSWSWDSAWSAARRFSPTGLPWRLQLAGLPTDRGRAPRWAVFVYDPRLGPRAIRRTFLAMRPRRGRVRRPRMRVRRLSGFSVNRLIPNVLTLLALCAGMTAIRFAVSENFEAACYAIIVAGVFDGLDGRMARLLKSTSRFGAELDSLADFISFGVAPALVLYLWTMSALHSIGWAIVLFFAICCALRLARFNTEIAAEPQPYASGFFSGVAAPGGAGVALGPMFFRLRLGDWVVLWPYLNGIWLGGIALLVV